jgi:hypothetical protein
MPCPYAYQRIGISVGCHDSLRLSTLYATLIVIAVEFAVALPDLRPYRQVPG